MQYRVNTLRSSRRRNKGVYVLLAIAHTGMRKMRTCGIADRLTAARPTV